ncbi:MAG: MBL fold metallo-hydrolase [Acidobacteriota bacterium]
MENRLLLLGTGTCQLDERRRASSALLEVDGLRVVYDMGRGIADRLAGLGLRQDDVEHLVLSHFHPDHLSDLIPYLHAAAWSQTDPRRRDLHIYGPHGLEVQVMRLLSLFGPDTLRRDHWQIHLHEIRADEISIAGRRFEFLDLPPAGNRGLRFRVDGEEGPVTVGITGDSGFHAQAVDFLGGTDLGIFDSGHLTDDEIVDLAVGSQAPRLVCSHVYRELDVDALGARARERGFSGVLEMGEDLQSFEL